MTRRSRPREAFLEPLMRTSPESDGGDADLQLWRAACAGDAVARAQLCNLATELFNGFLRLKRVLDDDIHDVANDAITVMLEHVRLGTEVRSLRPFLRGLAHGEFAKYVRKWRGDFNKLLRLVGRMPDPDGAPAPESRVLQVEIASALRDCLASLNEQNRHLLRLRYVEDKLVKDIAVLAGIPQKTAAVRFFRLVRFLRACLEGKGLAHR